MKVRTLVVALLTLLAWVGIASSQDFKGIYTPHKPGTGSIPVTKSNLDIPREVPPSGATWTAATTAPPASVGAMLLLTDGRVLVHSEPNCSGCKGNYSDWYTLTPDSTGSYINGTWLQVATLPSGYAPLFFGSAVLPDGKVVIQGGEYNCPNSRCSSEWQSAGAIYDPVANTWTSTVAPTGSNIGDAESVVLPDGTWMLAECCALAFGDAKFPVYYYFNESTLSFTEESNSADGKNDDFDEEGWTLLPNGLVLTADAYTSNTVLTGTNSETYNSATNTWSTAGSTINQLWDSNCEKGGGSYEEGPAVLRPDGTVYYTGASDCEAGHTSIYNSTTGTWTAGPDFPSKDAANDAPAALEINGNVIIATNPYSGTFSTPTTFYEWDGTNLNTFPNPPNATKTASYQGHLLVLPNGQIMYTDYSTQVEFLTSAGTYETAWQPTISAVAANLVPGSTNNALSGTQLNGLSQGAAYGDDFQDATNWALVQIVNNASGNVVYAKTHNPSTMAVATGSEFVETNFDVPATIETGASKLYVIANGIPSAAVSVTVGANTGTFTLADSPTKATVAPGGTTTAKIVTTVSGGFDSAVALTASGEGSGVSVKFNPSTIPAPGSGHAAMTIKVAPTAKAGTRTITITGTGGGVTQTATFTLTIS
jgi:hypothetical protein